MSTTLTADAHPRLQQLAHRLHALIGASPFTAADVARHVGVDRSAVSRWENGDRVPGLLHLLELAALLQVEPCTLLGEAPVSQEQQAVMLAMAQMTPDQQRALLAVARAIRPTS